MDILTGAWPVGIADRPSLLGDLRAARSLRDIAGQSGADLVHAHGIRAGWVTFLGCLPVPFAMTAHNLYYPPVNPFAGLMSRLALNRAHRIIAVSEAVKETLVAAGLQASKIVVIPNGINLPMPVSIIPRNDIRARFDVQQDAPLVLCVARLMADKGVDTLVSAWPIVAHTFPRARCVIAGDGPDRDALHALACDVQGLSLAGYVDDVYSLYGAADIVVIPSRREGQSIVCLEAMASKPAPAIVASNVGGLPEMVKDDATGLLAQPDNPSALADKIMELIGNPDLRERLSAAASILVNEKFTARAMAAATLSVYQSMGLSLRSEALE